jgi:hypothetical protein
MERMNPAVFSSPGKDQDVIGERGLVQFGSFLPKTDPASFPHTSSCAAKRLRSLVPRGGVSVYRLNAHAVVEALDPINDIQAGLKPGVIA